MKINLGFVLRAAFALAALSGSVRAEEVSARPEITPLVAQIQRADYEGDRAALKQLYEKLAPFVNDKGLGARVRYWRGFAMWRRAINGFNDATAPSELESDLQAALDEFAKIAPDQPGYADARIAMMSCLGNQIYLHRDDPARIQEAIGKIGPLAKEAKALAPDNPRLYWVIGPNIFLTPPERGGGQEKALETYAKGLELARQAKSGASDPLEPSWGEAEMRMSMAWTNLNRATPDLSAAEREARAALALVPYWHYVRDILLPQILATRAKVSAQPKSS